MLNCILFNLFSASTNHCNKSQNNQNHAIAPEMFLQYGLQTKFFHLKKKNVHKIHYRNYNIKKHMLTHTLTYAQTDNRNELRKQGKFAVASRRGNPLLYFIIPINEG